MKIFVCVKQVPDTETKIKINADKTGLDSAGIKWVVNPYDEFAIEESIKLRDQNPGSQIYVLTVGPKARAGEALRTALAMGADEAILVHTDQLLDVSATAHALAAAIKAEGSFDLVFAGKVAIDDNAASVPQMLAESLGVPHATVISKLNLSTGKATVERDVEGGSKEIIELPLPCVVAANKGLNMPRYASLPGIMKAKKKVIKEVDLATLNVSANSTTLNNFRLPADKPPVKILSGDLKAQVSQLVQLLRDEAKVL